MSKTVIITHLNFISAFKLLINKNIDAVIYYNRNLPDIFHRLLEKKHNIRRFDLNDYPRIFEDIEKEIINTAKKILRHENMDTFVDSIAQILCIKKSHIEKAVTKHFVKIVRDDVNALYLGERKYHNF